MPSILSDNTYRHIYGTIASDMSRLNPDTQAEVWRSVRGFGDATIRVQLPELSDEQVLECPCLSGLRRNVVCTLRRLYKDKGDTTYTCIHGTMGGTPFLAMARESAEGWNHYSDTGLRLWVPLTQYAETGHLPQPRHGTRAQRRGHYETLLAQELYDLMAHLAPVYGYQIHRGVHSYAK